MDTNIDWKRSKKGYNRPQACVDIFDLIAHFPQRLLQQMNTNQSKIASIILSIAFVSFASCLYTYGQTTIVEDGSIPAQLEILIQWNPELDDNADNFELTPTRTANLNDGTGRILVATMGGTIRVMRPNGDGYDLLPQPLLSSNQVGFQMQQESGMTSIALHPNFADNSNEFGYGRIYTITVENSAANGGLTNTDVDYPYFAPNLDGGRFMKVMHQVC